MKTEDDRWTERDGEKRGSSTESDGTDVERETDKEGKTGKKTESQTINGRERRKEAHTRYWASLASGQTLSMSLFL